LLGSSSANAICKLIGAVSLAVSERSRLGNRVSMSLVFLSNKKCLQENECAKKIAIARVCLRWNRVGRSERWNQIWVSASYSASKLSTYFLLLNNLNPSPPCDALREQGYLSTEDFFVKCIGVVQKLRNVKFTFLFLSPPQVETFILYLIMAGGGATGTHFPLRGCRRIT